MQDSLRSSTQGMLSVPARVLFVLGASVSACKQPLHQPVVPVAERPRTETQVPAPPTAATPARRVQTEADFIQPDDAPIDQAAELEAVRHNCCDEMPADEVKAHITSEDGAGARPKHRAPARVTGDR